MKDEDIIKELKSFPKDSLVFVTLKDDVSSRVAAENLKFTMERLRRLADEHTNHKFIVLHNAEVVPVDHNNPFIVVEVPHTMDEEDMVKMSEQMTQASGVETRIIRAPRGVSIKK
jgi:hypothetical protein